MTASDLGRDRTCQGRCGALAHPWDLAVRAEPLDHRVCHPDEPRPVRHNDHSGQRPIQLSICVERAQPRGEDLRIAAPVRMMRPDELPAAPLSIFHLHVHPRRERRHNFVPSPGPGRQPQTRVPHAQRTYLPAAVPLPSLTPADSARIVPRAHAGPKTHDERVSISRTLRRSVTAAQTRRRRAAQAGLSRCRSTVPPLQAQTTGRHVAGAGPAHVRKPHPGGL